MDCAWISTFSSAALSASGKLPLRLVGVIDIVVAGIRYQKCEDIMPRTVINLDVDNKNWLDQEARKRHVPMTELVRQAVHAYRLREESQGNSKWQHAVRDTAGIWHQGDGLAYQQRLRDEWDGKE